MKPAKFEFHAARSPEEAVTLLDRYDGDARILAGGQSLVPLMNFRVLQPRALVSINHCPELNYIRQEDHYITVGALCRQIDAEQSSLVQSRCPLLAAALPWVGGVANRNRGTVCGSLAHADPLAEIPAVAMALDAQFNIRGARGLRTIPVGKFFVSDLTTAIEPGEMLESVKFPTASPNSGAAFVEVGNRAHGFAVVGVAAYLEVDNEGKCTLARLAAIGVGSTPVRLRIAEAVVERANNIDCALNDVANCSGDRLEPAGGFHADAEYKKEVVGVLVVRAIKKAYASYKIRSGH